MASGIAVPRIGIPLNLRAATDRRNLFLPKTTNFLEQHLNYSARRATNCTVCHAFPRRSEAETSLSIAVRDADRGELDEEDIDEYAETDDDIDYDDDVDYDDGDEEEDVASEMDNVPQSVQGDGDDYILIGIISGTHGLKGEVKVRSETDFPQQRFQTAGIRWLRRSGMKRQELLPIHLVRGKVGPGKPPSWILKFRGINDVDQARTLVGSSLLVSPEDRPPLEEGEFYSQDLIGMDVMLQETAEIVGRIVDIVTGAAGELLRVEITNEEPPPVLVSSKKRASERATVGRLVWVPFVDPIVPVVNLERRIVEITPPKGLLDIGKPSEGKLKKLEKLEEQREQRKFLRRASVARKRYTSANQAHVLRGLKVGSLEDRSRLLLQLLSIDLRVLDRNVVEAMADHSSEQKSVLYSPPPLYPGTVKDFQGRKSRFRPADMERWRESGMKLLARGKVAAMAVLPTESSSLVMAALKLGFQEQAEKLLSLQREVSQVGRPAIIPWLILTSDLTDAGVRLLFEQEDNFGLLSSQIRFLKQNSHPCVSPAQIHGRHPLLLESTHRVADRPAGDGSFFQILTDSGALRELNLKGIEYLQVYSFENEPTAVADPLFFGYVHGRNADVGVKVANSAALGEESGVVCVCKEVDLTAVMDAEEGSGEEMEEEPEEERRYYTVVGFKDLPKEGFRAAANGRAAVTAAYVRDNVFSVAFLEGCKGERVPYRGEVEKLAALRDFGEESGGLEVEDVEAIVLSQRLSDGFKFALLGKVALLEVSTTNEENQNLEA